MNSGIDFCSALGLPVEKEKMNSMERSSIVKEFLKPNSDEENCFSGEINVIPISSSLFTLTNLSSLIMNWPLGIAFLCAFLVAIATFIFLPKLLSSTNKLKDKRRSDNDRRLSALEGKAKGVKQQ